jgi:hypothetical protein
VAAGDVEHLRRAGQLHGPFREYLEKEGGDEEAVELPFSFKPIMNSARGL